MMCAFFRLYMLTLTLLVEALILYLLIVNQMDGW